MNQIQEETNSNGFEIKTTCSFLIIVWMFIYEIIYGSLFILFSIYYYGSQDCQFLRYFCLIYGIILIPDSILTLLWDIYVQKNQNDYNIHIRSFRLFSFFINVSLCLVLVRYLLLNEDCGELKILAICFIIPSLIYFIYSQINARTANRAPMQNIESSNDNWG